MKLLQNFSIGHSEKPALDQYIPVYSFLPKWNVKVKKIHLVLKGSSFPVLFKIGHQPDK